MLANEWDVVELEAWGLDIPTFETEEVLEAEEDDFDASPPKEPITVLGDLYEIGEHRLLCGDSTDSDQVAKLMNGEKAELLLTDPPYLLDYSGGGIFEKNISKEFKDKLKPLINFNPDEFLNVLETLNVNTKYLFTSKDLLPKYFNYIDNTKQKFNLLTWHKSNPVPMTNGTWLPDTEYILYFYKKRKWNNKVNGYDYKKYFLGTINDGRKEAGNIHPTIKPTYILSPLIQISTDIKDNVLDLFLGSGSTMVASHQLKRKCYGMELDPKYCDVIVKRMIKLDPSLTIKRNGVVTKDFE
jgi:site-specific DNA-methyltransferase (adenine-specific)